MAETWLERVSRDGVAGPTFNLLLKTTRKWGKIRQTTVFRHQTIGRAGLFPLKGKHMEPQDGHVSLQSFPLVAIQGPAPDAAQRCHLAEEAAVSLGGLSRTEFAGQNSRQEGAVQRKTKGCPDMPWSVLILSWAHTRCN